MGPPRPLAPGFSNARVSTPPRPTYERAAPVPRFGQTPDNVLPELRSPSSIRSHSCCSVWQPAQACLVSCAAPGRRPAPLVLRPPGRAAHRPPGPVRRGGRRRREARRCHPVHTFSGPDPVTSGASGENPHKHWRVTAVTGFGARKQSGVSPSRETRKGRPEGTPGCPIPDTVRVHDVRTARRHAQGGAQHASNRSRSTHETSPRRRPIRRDGPL